MRQRPRVRYSDVQARAGLLGGTVVDLFGEPLSLDYGASVVLAVLAAGFASGLQPRARPGMRRPVVGAWAIIAPGVVMGHVARTANIWSHLVTGAVALVLGIGRRASTGSDGLEPLNARRGKREPLKAATPAHAASGTSPSAVPSCAASRRWWRSLLLCGQPR
jgi:hypothetical protein